MAKIANEEACRQQIMDELNRRKELHQAFWERRNASPLIGYSPGPYFISYRYEAAEKLLARETVVEPHMLLPGEFIADYERFYEESMRIGGDLFYTPEPFPGIPWIEAISGAAVEGNVSSFVAHPAKSHGNGKAWLDKYADFCRAITTSGKGRYICGQPILRGPADTLGTLTGQQNMIYDMFDDPNGTKKALNRYADTFLSVIDLTRASAGKLLGGSCMGFYHLWCPGNCLWFQDDLTSLMSPKLYETTLIDAHRRLGGQAEYTMMHLHMASEFVIDYLLEMDGLKAIQINKDIGGPPLSDMLPRLKSVLKRKNLVLWGDFTQPELDLLKHELNPEGLYIIVFAADK